MLILPIKTPLLKKGDSLVDILLESKTIQAGDIIVLSSKAIATCEGAAIDIRQLIPSEEAESWSRKTGRSAAFCEAVLQETRRMHGSVISHCPGAMLTEVRPEGLSSGTILTANAGLDESNIEQGYAIGWPQNPVASANSIRTAIEKKINGQIAVLITDSCVHPRRIGVGAFAMTYSGFSPLIKEIGKLDLFDKPLHITTEAVADQLATAANFLMGNAGQSTPGAIIRDHGLELTDHEGWVPAIEPNEDLFRGIV